MAHMFAVSPITTREALEQLRSEDLVETRRGRDGGSFITSSPSRNIQRLESNLLTMPTMEIKDHRALYIALVSSSARLATEEASARERNAILEAIQSLVNDLETAGTENDNYLTHGHHEMQLHIEIAAATTSPHLVNSLIDLQDKLKHLLWLRFADKEQIDFLAKQYKYAAHLLSTNQDQLFERRITDIIKVGFSWLVERKLALQQQHVENTLSPTTPIEVSHQIHDLFNVYAKTLHDWEMEITRQTAHSIINKQEFDSLAERLTHPALEQDRRIIGAGLIPSRISCPMLHGTPVGGPHVGIKLIRQQSVHCAFPTILSRHRSTISLSKTGGPARRTPTDCTSPVHISTTSAPTNSP